MKNKCKHNKIISYDKSCSFLSPLDVCHHVVLFSPLQVIDGKLAPFLSKVIKFASSHVFSCSLCREKGFICELCHNGQVIYPFQESATKRYTSILASLTSQHFIKNIGKQNQIVYNFFLWSGDADLLTAAFPQRDRFNKHELYLTYSEVNSSRISQNFLICHCLSKTS